MTTDFDIQARWVHTPADRGTEVESTLCRIVISVADRNVTEYVSSDNELEPHLDIPAYFLAEWFAENWWPLLWEPRKSEDSGDDADFISRHSTVTAQHGYALPKIIFAPVGRSIHVSATARDVQFADVRFRKSASISLPRQRLESQLKTFVDKVVARLKATSIAGTALQEAWELVVDTHEDEAQFCRFMGALGLSPYVSNGPVEAILDHALPALGERLLMDLCLASTPQNLPSVARAAGLIRGVVQSAPTSSLEPLASISAPSDQPNLPAWRRGVEAAKRVRARLGIADTDPRGADRFFERLGLDLAKASLPAEEQTDSFPLVGAVARDQQDIRIGLLQHKRTQRRFTAARAAYTAWLAEERQQERFLTLAVTRDQQASRAFAAELTAPFAYIRSQSSGGRLPQDRLFEVAANLSIEPDVVRKHAENNGLTVRPVY